MAGAVLRCFFLGDSTTFRQNRQPFPRKPGGAAATNTAGKNDLLRGRNKAERNCRRTQGRSGEKAESCRTKNSAAAFFCYGRTLLVLWNAICVKSTGSRKYFCGTCGWQLKLLEKYNRYSEKKPHKNAMTLKSGSNDIGPRSTQKQYQNLRYGKQHD